jgi:Mg2+ and Co2+ transporter CorA
VGAALVGMVAMAKHSYVPKTWELPDAIRRRLGETVGRQRLMDEDGHLLLLLHEPPSAEDDERRKAVLFWRLPDGQWKSTPPGEGLQALDGHLEAYRARIHRLDEEVEEAEHAKDYFAVMRHMHPLQRSTRSLLEVLQEAREARPNESRLISFRDHASDLERAIELVAADARAGMDYTLARNATEQAQAAMAANREARRLNRLVAFFFPMATLAAIFGMNPPHEVLSGAYFVQILGVGVLLGLMVYALIATGGRGEKS